MKFIIALDMLFFFEISINSQFILKDNVSFKFDDASYLVLLTINPDSLNPSFEDPCPPPYGAPCDVTNSALVRNHETSNIKVIIKSIKGSKMGTFLWEKLNPGIYKFDWWKYFGFDSSGVYYVDVNYKDSILTKKVLWIK